jgi:hypothetical protein
MGIKKQPHISTTFRFYMHLIAELLRFPLFEILNAGVEGFEPSIRPKPLSALQNIKLFCEQALFHVTLIILLSLTITLP